MKRLPRLLILPALLAALHLAAAANQPNIVVILADDLGYGDVSCYGATKIKTPNIDRVAQAGRRFTDAHATSSTCTPSRYAILTGRYPWRRADAKILPGDAPLLIPPGSPTLPALLRQAGYATAAIGKWHLGLGLGNVDWNGDIKPGPLEIGFDTCFLLPATGDRVPCVFVEDHRVVGLDPNDPIEVSYAHPVGHDPTGKDHPELLRYPPSHGHDQTIVNGVSRIGYMSGGKAARWIDEDIADTLVRPTVAFMERQRGKPFFLYLAPHNIHVPRLPNARFVGKSGLGLRGDSILELDAMVGQVLDALDRLKLADDTLLVVTSDNGPVVDDGYRDGSVEHLDGHTPGGPLRGGKYSAFEAGTRIPLIVRWPGHVQAGVSSALVSQIDFLATLVGLAGGALPPDAKLESSDASAALVGSDARGRDYVIEHAANGRLGITRAGWKYIEPGPGVPRQRGTGIETGNSREPQLYDLTRDVGETKNVANDHPTEVAELKALLAKVRGT